MPLSGTSRNKGGDYIKAIIVSQPDGEIIGHMGQGDTVLRKKSVEYLSDTVEWGKGRPFIKVFSDYFPMVTLELSGGAVMIMSVLSTYIAYGSNLLCNRSTNNPMNNKDIAIITGLSENTIKKYMEELVCFKVIARTRVGHSYQSYANPYIYCKGARINKTLEAMFKDYPEKYKV